MLQGGSSAIILGQFHPLLALLPLAGLPPFLTSKRANELCVRLDVQPTEQDRMARHLLGRATAIDAAKELHVFGLSGALIRRHRARVEESLRQALRDREALCPNRLSNTARWESQEQTAAMQ